MSSRRNSLSPPERTGTQDPGAHDLDSSDGEDHFSDAKSGPPSPSPIPRTRVEKVDDEPSYGEVPGTEAYKLREGDAEPDEIAIIPDPTSAPRSRANSEARPPTPGGKPIPKTMVEETPDSPGSVRHPEVEKKHRTDPPPDLVLKADGSEERTSGDGQGVVSSADSPISPALKTPQTARSRRKSSLAVPGSAGFGPEGDDEFGDDFDDFEEGDEDGDFGDFDESFQQPPVEPTPAPPQPSPSPAPIPVPTLSFPIPDFDSLDYDEIVTTTDPYLSALFPIDESDFPKLPPLPKDQSASIFQTPRSASLWSQLVAPPPLQPPDWIRSRIRRLFLVSLGVPVDLDEILPASKQKKLVLPSLHRTGSSGSLRTSTDSRSLARLKQGDNNASSTSLGSRGAGASGTGPASAGSGVGPSRRRKGPAQASFDIVSAKQLCMTTDAALDGMTDQELQAHVKKLQDLEGIANDLLEFWTKRTDEKIGDREAFEGVIENLVQHARKVRK